MSVCLQRKEVPKGFYTEKGGSIVHDMMLDEQMLIIGDGGQIALFLGCSHPGVVNCIKYAQKLKPNKSIKLLVGGMHLENVNPISLQMTIQHIQDMNIGMVAPLHCTGFEQVWELKRSLDNRCLIVCTGDTIKV